MKCEKCGNLIDSDDLVCSFCGADNKSHEEEIEVLNEVEENPSIVFSENISIEDLSVAKPKKKRKKKKKIQLIKKIKKIRKSLILNHLQKKIRKKKIKRKIISQLRKNLVKRKRKIK